MQVYCQIQRRIENTSGPRFEIKIPELAEIRIRAFEVEIGNVTDYVTEEAYFVFSKVILITHCPAQFLSKYAVVVVLSGQCSLVRTGPGFSTKKGIKSDTVLIPLPFYQLHQ